MDATSARWSRTALLVVGLLAIASFWLPLSVAEIPGPFGPRVVTRHGLLVWMEEAVDSGRSSAGRLAVVHGPCLAATLALSLIVGWYAVARPLRELTRRRMAPVRPFSPRYDTPQASDTLAGSGM